MKVRIVQLITLKEPNPRCNIIDLISQQNCPSLKPSLLWFEVSSDSNGKQKS